MTLITGFISLLILILVLDCQNVKCSDEIPEKATCNDPGYIFFGSMHGTDGSDLTSEQTFQEGQSVVYSCSPKEVFYLEGSSTLTCMPSGNWSNLRPICMRHTGSSTCRHPDAPKHGGIKCFPSRGISVSSYYHQPTCHASCAVHYRFEVPDPKPMITLNCDESGDWTPYTSFPDCHEVTPCKDPGFISDALRTDRNGDTVIHDNFKQGDWVHYKCILDGFLVIGSPYMFCNGDGSWDRPPPRCVRRQTTVPPEPVCPDPGHVRHGDRFNSDGSPSAAVQEYQVGESVEYKCHSGWFLWPPRSTITCLDSGQWSFERSACFGKPDKPALLRYCRDPGLIANGSRQPETSPNVRGFPPGSPLEYSCDQGYDLIGEQKLVCLFSGGWSASPPECKLQQDSSRRKYCLYPGDLVNGQVVYVPVAESSSDLSMETREEYEVGSQLRYACERGYTTEGSDTLTCESTGTWSPEIPPTCRNAEDDDTAYCNNPGRVLNGKVWYFAPGIRNSPGVRLDKEMDEYPEGSTLEYYCDKGYWLQGSENLMCVTEGYWSAKRPTCVQECGRSFAQSNVRIRNGQETVYGEWPWMVSISLQDEDGSRFICGGAVFNNRTVITAAHCLENGQKYILRFGKHHFKVEDDDSNVLVRNSSRVTIHPDYSRRTLDSDIALIHFQPEIEYSLNVQPICLPTTDTTVRNIVKGRVGYVSGWGDTEYELPSDKLLFAGLPVLSMRDCVRSYMEQNLTVQITGNMFCAGYRNGTYSVCGGDSGSPFVFYDTLSNRYTLEGLVSFVVRRRQDAQACGLPGRYAIFTRVYRFIPWMYENTE